jgi:hypothetical protein
MNRIEQIVAEARDKLTAAGSRFFMAYTIPHPMNLGETAVKLTSNSTREGISAILSAFLRLTPAGVQVMASELFSGARAAVGMAENEIVELATGGSFLGAARMLFEILRPHFTILGWETEPGEKPEPTKPV